MQSQPTPYTRLELLAEACTSLPDKQVLSLLNLDVNLDLLLDLAAPIDLAVAANANVAAPIDAAVSANVLTIDSSAQALGSQQADISQSLSGEAIAAGDQSAEIASGDGTTTGGTALAGAARSAFDQVPSTGDATGAVDGVVDGATGAVDGAAGDLGEAVDGAAGAVDDLSQTAADAVGEAIGALDTQGLLSDGLLNVNIDAAVDANLAAPVAGAVAANANVAAPISAAVAANIASVGSQAAAVADQTATIVQVLEDVTADASVAQESTIQQ